MVVARQLDGRQSAPPVWRDGDTSIGAAFANTASRRGFAYDGLPEDLVERLQTTAGRIRGRVAKQIEAIIAIGEDLLAVKEVLDHGHFIAWIQSECGFGSRAAQNYIRAALWTRQWLDGKSESVALFAPTAIYRLAAKSTPEEISASIVNDINAGRPPNEDDIRKRLAGAQDARRREREETARKLQRQRQRRNRAEVRAPQDANVTQMVTFLRECEFMVQRLRSIEPDFAAEVLSQKEQGRSVHTLRVLRDRLTAILQATGSASGGP